MVRVLTVAFAAIAALTLLAEGLGAALLWSQGRLNPDTIREIRMILRDPVTTTDAAESDAEAPVLAIEDIVKARSIRILNLEEREREQELLKAIVSDSREAVLAEQAKLKASREMFMAEQKLQADKGSTAAIEKARNVLLKAQADAAMGQLMNLTLEENVIIVQEMPEKKIADLLAAFAAGDKDQVLRGEELFQAITRGRVESADSEVKP